MLHIHPLRLGRWLPAILAIAASSPAAALKYTESVNIAERGFNDQPIRVQANADGYTVVETPKVHYRLDLTGKCTAWGKADISDVWIYRGNGDHYRADHIDLGWDDRTVSEISEIDVTLTGSEKQKAVQACQSHLASRIAQGATEAEILYQDQIIAAPQLHRARHTLSCTGNLHLTGDAKYKEIDVSNTILCKKAPGRPPAPPTGPGNLAIPFGVNEATLDANPKQQVAYSKGTVNFQGAITVSGVHGKQDVLYRLVHNGAYGPVQKMTFVNQSGTGHFGFSIDVPCQAPPPGNTLGGGSGNGGQGIGGFQAPTTPGQKNGTARIVIVKPTNGVQKSNDTFYTVNCKDTGTMTPNLPDLVVQGATLSAEGLKVIVRNKGAAGAPATELKVRIGTGASAVVKQVAVPALAKGASTEVLVSVPPAGEKPTYFLHVDNPPKVKELHENNNTYSTN